MYIHNEDGNPLESASTKAALGRSVINELTSGEIVSLNFIESIKEARSRVQDLTSGEIMASDHVSSDLVPQCSTKALSPGPQSQENIPQAAETVTTLNELDLLFSLMFDELLNGTTLVVSKSSAVTATNAHNQRQQQHTTPSTSTTVAADIPPLNI
ncbi:hypothetical protein Tco_0245890 [Tanacetum coccineum]